MSSVSSHRTPCPARSSSTTAASRSHVFLDSRLPEDDCPRSAVEESEDRRRLVRVPPSLARVVEEGAGMLDHLSLFSASARPYRRASASASFTSSAYLVPAYSLHAASRLAKYSSSPSPRPRPSQGRGGARSTDLREVDDAPADTGVVLLDLVPHLRTSSVLRLAVPVRVMLHALRVDERVHLLCELRGL